MPGARGLRTRAARHRHRGRVPCRHITGALAGWRCTPRHRSVPALPHITGALAGWRCKPWRRSVPALSLLICFARRCRQPKLPGSASRIVVLIVAATLTDIPMPCMALALGPLGTGKGGFQLRRRTSYSTRRSAGRPAPTHGAGTAASPGCAAARRRRRSAAPAPRSRTGSRTRAAAPDRAGRSRQDGPGCALRGSADWRPGAWSARGVADRPAR